MNKEEIIKQLEEELLKLREIIINSNCGSVTEDIVKKAVSIGEKLKQLKDDKND